MPQGTVKWFNPTKGYGFIQPADGGKDVFVHISTVEKSGIDRLNENAEIFFEIVPGRDGKDSADRLSLNPPQKVERSALRPETAHNEIAISVVVTPESAVSNEPSGGRLIAAISPLWDTLVPMLRKDWPSIHRITPETFEELVATAYDKEGYEVTLTPRSGDHGRDLIAVRRGLHSIKIIGSAKRYTPGHLVEYDDIRALLGVMYGERNASKGVLITSSDFPPLVLHDPFIAPFVPYRLQLINGSELKSWIFDLSERKPVN